MFVFVVRFILLFSVYSTLVYYFITVGPHFSRGFYFGYSNVNYLHSNLYQDTKGHRLPSMN